MSKPDRAKKNEGSDDSSLSAGHAMSRFTPVIYGVAIGLGVVFGLSVKSCNGPSSRDDVLWQHSVDSAARVTVEKMKLKVRADTVYDTARVSYVTYRDRILQSGTATARDSMTFKLADKVVASCDTVRITSNAVIESVQGEKKLQEQRPGPRRVQFFGEALYNMVAAAPVVRLGMTVKLLGPVDLSLAGEAERRAEVPYRALVGVRIRF